MILNKDEFECIEEFTRKDLETAYSPLCRHHLFEDENAAAKLDDVYKRIQAKIYMRLIFRLDKDSAKTISKEVADRNANKISNMLIENSGWDSVILHIDIVDINCAHTDAIVKSEYSLKDSYIIGSKNEK